MNDFYVSNDPAFGGARLKLDPAMASQSLGVTGAVNSSVATTTQVIEQLGGIRQTVFKFTALPLTLRDTEQGQGVKIYDFPEGAIAIHGAIGSIALTTTSVLADTLNAGVTYNWGVGTTTQANGTLATTEQNIIPTTNGTASATINVAGAASKGALAVPLILNGMATASDLFLNVGVAGATDIDANATVTIDGTVVVLWSWLGDF